MGKTRYPILGWVVWQIGSRVVKRKLAQPRVKVGAAAVVALALAAAPGIRPRRRFPLLRRSRPERVPSQPPRARLLILGVVPDSVARFGLRALSAALARLYERRFIVSRPLAPSALSVPQDGADGRDGRDGGSHRLSRSVACLAFR